MVVTPEETMSLDRSSRKGDQVPVGGAYRESVASSKASAKADEFQQEQEEEAHCELE